MNNIFPEEFIKRMKGMLNAECDAFLKALSKEEAYSALRINTLKRGAKEAVLEEIGGAEQVKWCEDGYYADKTVISGKHPYHVGGLVYFQEPSAMLTVEALGIEEGDFVLDLCASPGGKTTQAAAKLSGSGLLMANEIIPKRAAVLTENVQRMGIKNAVVTNESPEKLADKYIEFFDKIIVDAPCSGEGMFKKEPRAVLEWSIQHTYSCASRQKKILESAFSMLKGGGKLVYSTCTFAPCENEGIVDWVLESYPDVKLLEIKANGVSNADSSWTESPRNMAGAKRIFPHKSKGEGHFTALFYKENDKKYEYPKVCSGEAEKLFREFEQSALNTHFEGEFLSFGDRLFVMPCRIDIDKIKVLSAGLFLGTLKKGRFEPSHALCLALSKEDFKSVSELENPEIFFHGETVRGDNTGWTAMLYKGYPVGWGKGSEGIIKNHFPKSQRF